MGKRKKNKKYNKVRKVLSKKKFLKRYCNVCGICWKPDPGFCFDLYAKDPDMFTDSVLPLLVRRFNTCLNGIAGAGFDPSDFSGAEFRETFCKHCPESEYDAHFCSNLTECMVNFLDQEAPYNKTCSSSKVSVEVYPTFFSRDNTKWLPEISKMIGINANGDNPEESDPAEGSPGDTEVSAGVKTKAAKS